MQGCSSTCQPCDWQTHSYRSGVTWPQFLRNLLSSVITAGLSFELLIHHLGTIEYPMATGKDL